jgi:hypothetical protein
VRCWENTQYVSKCSGDIACLCSEPDYQNVRSFGIICSALPKFIANSFHQSVYQCLYSQCDTVYFGPALHHSISRCFGTGNQILFAAPPIPNRDSLRRREAEYAAGGKIYGSGSAVAYPTESANLPTQSVPYATQSVVGPYYAGPTSSLVPYFPLNTSPATASATPTPTQPAYSPLPDLSSVTSPQVLFTGDGRSNLCPARFFVIVVAIAVTYSTL